MPGKVFISHSTRDDAVVAEIRRALEGLGHAVWVDSRELAPGAELEPEVQRAIEEARCLFAVLSTHAVNSPWVRKEVQHALAVKRRRSDGFQIVPVLLAPIEPSALPLWFDQEPVALKVEVGPGGIQAALPRLLEALGEELPRDPEEPRRPPAPPVSELILELTDPRMLEQGGERRAAATARLVHDPADGTPRVESRRFAFKAPLGPIEAGELAWYLERYPQWPGGVFRERAVRVEEQLPEWGRRLHAALDVAPAREVLAAWQLAGGEGSRCFTVEVDQTLVEDLREPGTVGAGDGAEEAARARLQADEAATLLLALPWELLADGEGYLFQGARPVRVRRRLPNLKKRQPLFTEPPLRVLLLSPRPEDEIAAYIDHRASALPLVEALAGLGDLARLTLLEPPTFPALGEELRRAWEAGEPYHVVHFDGHGIYDRKRGLGALCFERPEDVAKLDGRRTHEVHAEELAGLVRGYRVPLVFLEACQSAAAEQEPTASVAGRLLQQGVASVAAMSHSVLVETARRFTGVFYRELAAGRRIGEAMLGGQQALFGDAYRGKAFTGALHLADWFVPVLFQEEGDPQLVAEVPAARVREAVAAKRRLALGALPEPPPHGFVGRSREMLRAERLLARESYAVLRGQGGEGKTALAAELARWLVASRRCRRAAFVSLERHGDARGLLFTLGEQLVPDYVRESGGDPERGEKLLVRALAEEATVVVVDNVESILPLPALGATAAPGAEPDPEAGAAPAATGDEEEILAAVLELCRRLGRVGQTRLLFTSREALPEPFAGHHLPLGRLRRREAVELVARVLGEGELMPHAADTGESDEEIDRLVEAVGCHARSLVLLAREVAQQGVRDATERVQELMAGLHARHPDDRERSLIASVELSLRRLPAGTRAKLGPLGVFQGGGHLGAIARVLSLDTDKDEEVALARQLVAVGLAEELPYGYLRFDPALGPALLAGLEAEERQAARAAWAETEAELIEYLYRQKVKEPQLAATLTLLDLPNLLPALEHLARQAPPERVVDLADSLERLLAELGRPKALARASRVRERAAAGLGEWSHARFQADFAAIDRLFEAGRSGEAVKAARGLLAQAEAAGEAAFAEAAYDLALCHFRLGCALGGSGDAAAALASLAEARGRFETMADAGIDAAARMALACLTEKGGCLRRLGRLDEAAETYKTAIALAERRGDPRSVATGKFQLGTVRMLQRAYAEALAAYHEARRVFKSLGEARSVATAWHQIGMVHSQTDQFEPAERAYKESLSTQVETGDRSGEASNLIAEPRTWPPSLEASSGAAKVW
ncbi:MAG TPA: TIR domain-containing protein [Thermoanaerobaculia bacterium]|nr:TIR domain-containing protein [Thermoanaerobaculia bacterium]